MNYTLFANIGILINVFLHSLKVETECEIYYLHTVLVLLRQEVETALK